MKANAKKWMGRLAVLATLTLVGCGQQQTVLPPVTNPYGVGYSGTCAGGVANAGQPISNSALNASLTDNNGTVVGSIQLFLYSTGQYTVTDPTPSIVGTGSISFTDASILYGGYANYGQQQTSFCISSQDPTGGGVFTGAYGASDGSLAIAMKGLTSMPSVNPYTGYPTGSGSQQSITVSIGYDCGTYISGQSRFQGCVRLDMGGGYGTVLWAN